jgi:hypothetical protein
MWSNAMWNGVEWSETKCRATPTPTPLQWQDKTRQEPDSTGGWTDRTHHTTPHHTAFWLALFPCPLLPTPPLHSSLPPRTLAYANSISAYFPRPRPMHCLHCPRYPCFVLRASCFVLPSLLTRPPSSVHVAPCHAMPCHAPSSPPFSLVLARHTPCHAFPLLLSPPPFGLGH